MDHSAVMRRAYELINAGDIEGFGSLLADDFVEHEELPGFASTKQGTLGFFRMMRAAFPDMRMNVEDVIAGGEKAVARVVVNATHEGEFMGVPPAGKSIDVKLIDIMRFDDAGLVCEHWGIIDMLSLVQQLGIVPAGPTA